MAKKANTKAVVEEVTFLTGYKDFIVSRFIEVVKRALIAELVKRHKVRLNGFGTFSVHWRKPQRRRNLNGEGYTTDKGGWSVRFKMGNDLRNALDRQEDS